MEIPVYENCSYSVGVGKEPAKGIETAGFDAVFFTCASSVKRFIHAFGKDWGRCRAYSIGIEAIQEARQSTYEGLVECVIEHIG